MNVVFDLGGVIVAWRPEAIMESVFPDPRLRDKVRSGVFSHPDWFDLDRGTLERDPMIARAARRTGLEESAIRSLMDHVPPSLVPIPGSIELLYRVKAQPGNRVFCLSNMHFASIEHLERAQTFWDAFEGSVISCRLRMIKPEPAIYIHLLKSHGLEARRTVFIDDTQVNLDAAAALGIRTIRFENPQQCESSLRAMGCIP